MEGLEAVEKQYSQGWCKRCCILSCGCCCSAKYKELKKKHFFKQWPSLRIPAVEPDNIQWNNLGVGPKSRFCRVSFVWLITFILILASLIGIVIMKRQVDLLKTQYNSDVVCPNPFTSAADAKLAYEDFKKNDNRDGLMGCYCKGKLGLGL